MKHKLNSSLYSKRHNYEMFIQSTIKYNNLREVYIHRSGLNILVPPPKYHITHSVRDNFRQKLNRESCRISKI